MPDETPVDPASINWESLLFDYVPTRCIAQYNYADGEWDEGQLTSPQLSIHPMSNALHYGQALFEGLKAFHTADGKVHVFNADENAKRLQAGAARLGMPEVSTDLFNEALDRVIEENIDYVPPYGTGGALYIRPFLFGHGAKLGLGPAPEYKFCVLVSPVGTYYKTGIKAVDAVVPSKYDRAAPKGVGNIKAAGNYAPDVEPAAQAVRDGYTIALYLDAKTNSFVEEFSTSNFVAISGDKSTYITPESDSILPSITNKMLMQLASDRGLRVERRPVSFSEISTFSEVAAAGTAVIITPIKSVTNESKRVEIGENFDIMKSLHDDLRAIQTGDAEDVHGWCRNVCDKPMP